MSSDRNKWLPYTREDIAEIRRLVGRGLSYRVVAGIMGRSHSSIKVVMMKSGRDQLSFKKIDQAALTAHIYAEHKRGKDAKQIANELGWTQHRVLMRLLRAKRAANGDQSNDG
jgi:DNA-binding CsgD family transcriptional regulator